jgi:hypothetical protein
MPQGASVVSPAWLLGPPLSAVEFWGTAIVTICAVYLFLAGLSIDSYFERDPGQQVIPWPGSIAAGIPVTMLLLGYIALAARARTILFTQTRASAPTFWQANRTAIAINVVVAGLSARSLRMYRQAESEILARPAATRGPVARGIYTG